MSGVAAVQDPGMGRVEQRAFNPRDTTQVDAPSPGGLVGAFLTRIDQMVARERRDMQL